MIILKGPRSPPPALRDVGEGKREEERPTKAVGEANEAADATRRKDRRYVSLNILLRG